MVAGMAVVGAAAVAAVTKIEPPAPGGKGSASSTAVELVVPLLKVFPLAVIRNIYPSIP